MHLHWPSQGFLQGITTVPAGYNKILLVPSEPLQANYYQNMQGLNVKQKSGTSHWMGAMGWSNRVFPFNP
jgi:hypothetical protein